MPNRSKRRSSVRRRRPRQRGPIRTHILDLPDDMLLKIQKKLGLVDVLSPKTLRTVAPAFALAQTCTRMYKVFINHITELDAKMSPVYPPPLYHEAHSEAHLQWLVRNLPKLQKLKLPEERSRLVNELPPRLQLESLDFNGDYDRVSPTRFPRTLSTLRMADPTPSTMECLTNLHERACSCRLQKIWISNVRPALAEQLREFFTHSCGQVKEYYSSFMLSTDHEQRENDNAVVTDVVQYICSNHETCAPRLSCLSLAVTCESRLDHDFSYYDLDLLQPLVDEVRQENMRQSSLQLLLLFTDVDILESWFNAVRYAITPTVSFSVETGRNTFLYIAPLLKPHLHDRIVTVRLSSNMQLQRPNVSRLRALLDQPNSDLVTLHITDRAVAEKYFYSPQREPMLAYVASAPRIINVYVHFALGLHATRIAFWEDSSLEDAWRDFSLLLTEFGETPEHVAYTFVAAILSTAKGVERLSISFEAVMYTPGNETSVERVLLGIADATTLDLTMPVSEYERHPSKGLVNATERFLIGLPPFLRTLSRCCAKLETLSLVDLGDITWSEPDCDQMGLLCAADAALDAFEMQRPDVEVESVRAMLEYWRSSLGA